MTIHFLGGLPRSCSTALAAILNQNPDFYASATSPLPMLVESSIEARTTLPFKALTKPELDSRMPHIFRGIIQGWYESTSAEHCFDKSRSWLGKLDLLKALYEVPKVIVPVRDIRGIVASLEKLYRNNPGVMDGIVDINNHDHATIQGRVDAYLNSSMLGFPLNFLFDARQRGQLKNCLIVRAESLTSNPEIELRKIHAYLGLKYFSYDFDNIESKTWENDAVHEPFGEHTVGSSLSPMSEDWDDILTPKVSADIKARCAWFYEAFYQHAV